MPNRELSAIRNHYQKDALDWDKLQAEPLASLQDWLQTAIASELYEPTAMTLATVDAQGKPHARVVLLKGIDQGLLFYTNYLSAKGEELASHQQAAITLFWPELERQIRVEGVVEKIDAQASDVYFHSRPLDSQLAASISRQSQVVADREALETAFQQAKETSIDGCVERPEHWGGYRLVPDYFEFWQGRPNRLHDRLRWRREADTWVKERLAP